MMGSGATLLGGDGIDATIPDPVTEYAATGVYPVPPSAQYHQANTGAPTPAQDGQWDGATADQEYITPNMGGEPGKAPALGWSTGLGLRRLYTSPITGRVLIPPSTNVMQSGPVGLKNFDTNLTLGVMSQSLVLPSTDAIAASFINPDPRQGILLGAQ